MLGTTNCNEGRCPGWLAVIIVGVSAYFLSFFLFINDAFSEVRIDITRELPDETQHIVRIFEDKEDFEMWMSMKMEYEGCDPYVTEMIVKLDNHPKSMGFNEVR
ncbi:hypothetical protein OAL99_02685 [Gammaproteobacteria bacterium]|nr:hypothetical protein [Gammaproteobacteria bacterium]